MSESGSAAPAGLTPQSQNAAAAASSATAVGTGGVNWNSINWGGGGGAVPQGKTILTLVCLSTCISRTHYNIFGR